jgi:hypothetical protein
MTKSIYSPSKTKFEHYNLKISKGKSKPKSKSRKLGKYSKKEVRSRTNVHSNAMVHFSKSMTEVNSIDDQDYKPQTSDLVSQKQPEKGQNTLSVKVSLKKMQNSKHSIKIKK